MKDTQLGRLKQTMKRDLEVVIDHSTPSERTALRAKLDFADAFGEQEAHEVAIRIEPV